MITSKLLNSAIIAWSEKYGKLKFDNLDTFILKGRHGNDYQVITNPAKRHIYSLDNKWSSNEAMILIPHIGIESVNIHNHKTSKINQVSTIYTDIETSQLNPVEVSPVFIKQFEMANALDTDYLFEIDLSEYQEELDNYKIKYVQQGDNVVSFVSGEKYNLRYGSVITKAILVGDSIFHNLAANNSLIKNTLGSAKASRQRYDAEVDKKKESELRNVIAMKLLELDSASLNRIIEAIKS